MGINHWNDGEILLLKENYQSKGLRWCLQRLNRSKMSVIIKARRLRLRDYTVFWSPEEVSILKDNYKFGARYCTKLLNRNYYSIRKKIVSLRLKLTKEEILKVYSRMGEDRWKNLSETEKNKFLKRAKTANFEYIKTLKKSLTGKKRITHQGYVVIKDYDHPNRNDQHEVFEHVKVMSDYLGRPIKDGEIIHHINMDKTDNKIGNLYLYPNNSEHKKAHMDVSKLMKQLLDDNIIIFKEGKYYKNNI